MSGPDEASTLPMTVESKYEFVKLYYLFSDSYTPTPFSKILQPQKIVFDKLYETKEIVLSCFRKFNNLVGFHNDEEMDKFLR